MTSPAAKQIASGASQEIVPDEVRASVNGYDVACRSILKLADAFGARVFTVTRPNGKEVRVLAFNRAEAEDLANGQENRGNIVPFAGTEERAVPAARPLIITEVPESLSAAYELRLKRILVRAARDAADMINIERLANASYLHKHLTKALVDAVDAQCEPLLEAAKVSDAKIIAQREAEEIVSKARDKARELLKTERAKLAGDLAQSRKALRRIKQELKIANSLCWQHHYPPVPPAVVEANYVYQQLPAAPGIYFVWNRGRVVYVGQSTNLSNRCNTVGHHAIQSGDSLSWVEQPATRLNFAESFYIGILKPERNFGVRAQRWE